MFSVMVIDDIRNLVGNLKTRGIGVLITDHNVRDTLKLVDRAYILHDGQMLMSGTTEEIVNDENVRRFIGDRKVKKTIVVPGRLVNIVV